MVKSIIISSLLILKNNKALLPFKDKTEYDNHNYLAIRQPHKIFFICLPKTEQRIDFILIPTGLGR